MYVVPSGSRTLEVCFREKEWIGKTIVRHIYVRNEDDSLWEQA